MIERVDPPPPAHNRPREGRASAGNSSPSAALGAPDRISRAVTRVMVRGDFRERGNSGDGRV